jgi:hypothetical protein
MFARPIRILGPTVRPNMAPTPPPHQAVDYRKISSPPPRKSHDFSAFHQDPGHNNWCVFRRQEKELRVKRTFIILAVLLAAWIAVRLAVGPGDASAGNRNPGTVKANVTITARVDEFTEWADAAPVIFEADWSGALSQVNQQQTVSKRVILYTNADAVVSPRPGLNNGILTHGSYTLDTAYKLTGAVASPDQRFKPVGEFFGAQNVYIVAHVAGTGAYALNLEVQMSSPPSAAPEQGLYTCGVTLTAGW